MNNFDLEIKIIPNLTSNIINVYFNKTFYILNLNAQKEVSKLMDNTLNSFLIEETCLNLQYHLYNLFKKYFEYNELVFELPFNYNKEYIIFKIRDQ